MVKEPTTPNPDSHPHPATVSPWVARFAPLVPAGGAVLDLACGGGRHGRLFLERGHPVTLLDRDLAGVADLERRAELLQADLEGAPWPLPGRRFAGVVVTNYLWRPLFQALAQTLAEGGVLIYETFGRGNERFGRPRNPDHLLAPNELLEAFAPTLQVVAYEHGVTGRPAVVQRLCAVRTAEPVGLD